MFYDSVTHKYLRKAELQERSCRLHRSGALDQGLVNSFWLGPKNSYKILAAQTFREHIIL